MQNTAQNCFYAEGVVQKQLNLVHYAMLFKKISLKLFGIFSPQIIPTIIYFQPNFFLCSRYHILMILFCFIISQHFQNQFKKVLIHVPKVSIIYFEFKHMKNQSLAILFFFGFIALTIQGSSFENCCDLNQISVTGNSRIQLKPDIATVTVYLEGTGRTTSDALQDLNAKVSQALSIISSQGINKQDFFTQRLSIFPEYNYINGVSVFVGQRASQTLVVTIRGFDISGSTIGQFIDAIVVIKGVQINGVNFDREDKANAIRQARKAAYDDAYIKASQYARLSGLKLLELLNLNDYNQVSIFPVFKSVGNAAAEGIQTTVPVQNVIVTGSITAVWAL